MGPYLCKTPHVSGKLYENWSLGISLSARSRNVRWPDSLKKLQGLSAIRRPTNLLVCAVRRLVADGQGCLSALQLPIGNLSAIQRPTGYYYHNSFYPTCTRRVRRRARQVDTHARSIKEVLNSGNSCFVRSTTFCTSGFAPTSLVTVMEP